MSQQSDQAMAKIGSTFFWNDVRRQQQRGRGDRIERASIIGEAPVDDDLAPLYPRGRPPRVDGKEDFNMAERNQVRTRNDPSGKVLALASALVILVVVALLGLTLAV